MPGIRENFGIFFAFFLTVVVIFVWGIVLKIETRDYLTVAFLDVGQGDAIFIEAPNGNQIIIDGGPNKKALSELSKVMPFYDRSIDALILSHSHQDHIGGLVEILKRYNVGVVFMPKTETTLAEYTEWKKLTKEKGVNEEILYRGARIWLAEDIVFDVLLPYENEECGDKTIHNCMLVGRLSYGKICFLMTGDMERNLEYKIISDDINCEVLKVGHHGSKTSTSDAFLRSVSPNVSVIQVGKDNRYGHPHEIVLNKIQSAGINILRTDVDGSIVFKTSGEKIWRVK